MAENTFPVRITAEVREFYNSTRYGIPEALAECGKNGYRPLFMPEIADARIAAEGNDRILQVWWTSPSVRATGRGKPSSVSHKGGTEFAVYGHVPNYFSIPENVRAAIDAGLVNGAGFMPQEEFQKLLDMEDGEEVLAVEQSLMKKWPSGVYGIETPKEEHMKNYSGKIDGVDMIAINHPQTKRFLGPKNAEPYLEKHSNVYGKQIGIWHSDDLSPEADKPLARLLFVGGGGGLGGGYVLENYGRFAGVREGAGGARPAKSGAPGKEQVIRLVSQFVAPCDQPEMNQRISALYQ